MIRSKPTALTSPEVTDNNYKMSTYPTYKRQKNDTDAVTTQKYYLNNAALMPEVVASKAAGRISPKLAEMLLMLATRYASKPSFANYTFREDMVAEALADLCKNALKFNPEKSNNPFSFYTTCVHNSFLGFLNIEKKQRRIKDQLLVDLGENPSYGFQDEYKASMGDEGTREGLTELKGDISDARERLEKERQRERDEKIAEAKALGELLEFDEVDTTKVLPLISEEHIFEDDAVSEDNE